MSLYFTMVDSNIFSDKKKCFSCTSGEDTLSLPCSHNFCKRCFYLYYKKKILSLSKLLNQSPHLLDGKASYIGCPAFCKNSALTISPEFLENLFLEFRDIENSKIIRVASYFLSGIPSYFFKCNACNKLTSSFNLKIQCDLCNTENKVEQILEFQGIRNNFPYILTNSINEPEHLGFNGSEEFLIVLKNEFDYEFFNDNEGLKVNLLNKYSYHAYNYFALVKARPFAKDDHGIFIRSRNDICYSNIYMIIKDNEMVN